MRISVGFACFCALGLAFLVFLMKKTETQQPTLPSQELVAKTVFQNGINTAKTNLVSTPQSEKVTNAEFLVQQIEAALNSENPGDHEMVFTNLMLNLIAQNPRAAARFAESPNAGSWRTELMRVLAQNWARSNLADAEKWVTQLSDPNERDTMLGCVCFEVANENPGLAIQTLERQGLNDRRITILGNLAQQWASLDLASASAWAKNYPEGEIRDNLFMHIALAQSETAPSQSAQIVAEQIMPGTTQEEAAFAVLQRWAEADITGANSWVELFPPGAFQDRAKQEVWRISTNASDQIFFPMGAH